MWRRKSLTQLNLKKIFSLGWGYYVSNNTALMAGNCSGSEFYGVRPPSIPTKSLCVDKPVSKSIGLRASGLLRTGRGCPALSSYFRWTLWKHVVFFTPKEDKVCLKTLYGTVILKEKKTTTLNKNLSMVKNNHWELLSKVCFKEPDHEWDAESVEPGELIWAKWGRKLAPTCETKRLRRAIKKTSTSQKRALRTLCYPPLQNQPRGPAGKGLAHSVLMLSSIFNHSSR